MLFNNIKQTGCLNNRLSNHFRLIILNNQHTTRKCKMLVLVNPALYWIKQTHLSAENEGPVSHNKCNMFDVHSGMRESLIGTVGPGPWPLKDHFGGPSFWSIFVTFVRNHLLEFMLDHLELISNNQNATNKSKTLVLVSPAFSWPTASMPP